MASLFETGRVIDLILCFVLVEAALLTLALRTRLPARDAAVDVACLLLPGVFLLMAVKAALVSAAWEWTAIALAAALLAHLVDVARRIWAARFVKDAERHGTKTGGTSIRTRGG